MENNSTNEVNENSSTVQGKILDQKKMTIINLMFVKRQGATLASNRESIKNFPIVTAEEKAFIDEVYTILQELKIDEDIFSIDNIEQVKETLYERCQIPREIVEKAKQARQDQAKEIQEGISKDYKEWARQDAETARKSANAGRLASKEPEIFVVQGGVKDEAAELTVGYKKELYQPGFLCGRSAKVANKPFVEHIQYTPERVENTSPETSYQFADKIYTIKKVGELVYMSTPNLKDSLSEYEITISKENMSRTVKRFGEISFHKMSDAAYSTVVFLQLLGADNLTDKELHGYMGSVEQVRDKNGKLKDEYGVVHLPEEYTAVAVWEQIENEKKKEIEIRVAGGEER